MNQLLSNHRYSLHLLPLVVAGIAIATSAPIEFRTALWLRKGFNSFDLMQNLLLYMPLGAALSRRSWWAIAGAAALLSVSAETLQMWSVGRFTSHYDVMSNVLGALIGAWGWRRYGRRNGAQVKLAVNGFWLIVASVAAIAVLALWNFPSRSEALSNWDADFSLLFGNESTNDRPWRGTIHGLQILPGAMTREEIRVLDHDAENVFDREVLFRIAKPMKLDGGPAVRAPISVSELLVNTIAAEGAFSVIARIQTADLEQDGPARIISFSEGTLKRNFDLGQEQGRIVWRVRTPVSGENGEGFRAETTPILEQSADALVVATYDGSVSRIHVNGELLARSNIAAGACFSQTLCDVSAPLGWAILGGAFAMIVLGFTPWRGKAARASAALGAGAAVTLMAQRLELGPPGDDPHSWMPYLALVGAAVIAVAHVEAPSDGLSAVVR